MSRCCNLDEPCGLHEVSDVRCCCDCEFVGDCEGTCITLQDVDANNMKAVAEKCEDYEEEE